MDMESSQFFKKKINEYQLGISIYNYTHKFITDSKGPSRQGDIFWLIYIQVRE